MQELKMIAHQYNPQETQKMAVGEIKSHVFLSLLITETSIKSLLKSYLDTFSTHDDCTLILVPARPGFDPEIIFKWLEEWEFESDQIADLMFLDLPSSSELPSLFALCQTYISTDTEGQDQNIFKALAMNKYSIAFATHAHQKLPPEAITLCPAEQYTSLVEAMKKSYIEPVKNCNRELFLKHFNIQPKTQQTLIEQMDNTEVVAIFSWGRSGSRLIQSLLDSHPEVLIANGPFGMGLVGFHSFIWPQIAQQGFTEAEKLVDYFCHITHADHLEDPEVVMFTKEFFPSNFKTHLIKLLENLTRQGHAITRRWFFLALHYAYALTMGQDIGSKRLIIYQLHHPENYLAIQNALTDFPQMKAIGTLRHPLRNFNSMLANQRKRAQQGLKMGKKHPAIPDYNFEDLIPEGIYSDFYQHMLIGWTETEKLFQDKFYPLRLEDIHFTPESTLRQISQWLDIDWNEQLLESTLDGKPFTSESGVHQKQEGVSGFDPERVMYNSWQKHISLLDSYIMMALLEKHNQKHHYGKVSWLQKKLAPVLLFAPSKLEIRSLWKGLKKKDKKHIHNTVLSILERRFYNYKYLTRDENDFPARAFRS